MAFFPCQSGGLFIDKRAFSNMQQQLGENRKDLPPRSRKCQETLFYLRMTCHLFISDTGSQRPRARTFGDELMPNQV